MTNGYTKICVRKSTKKLLDENVREEILRHNPKLRGMKIGYDYLVSYIAEYFIED